ncbi:SOS response-associated peptidase [Halalkalibacter akibai]|nr:SOS response-associated peptidase [Halalkalibacter akibai]
MPAIIPDDIYDIWLDPTFDDTEYLKSLLIPYNAEDQDPAPLT